MLKREIEIGQVYTAKISNVIVKVRIESENPFGGWNAISLKTNRRVRIKSAAKLRAKVAA